MPSIDEWTQLRSVSVAIDDSIEEGTVKFYGYGHPAEISSSILLRYRERESLLKCPEGIPEKVESIKMNRLSSFNVVGLCLETSVSGLEWKEIEQMELKCSQISFSIVATATALELLSGDQASLIDEALRTKMADRMYLNKDQLVKLEIFQHPAKISMPLEVWVKVRQLIGVSSFPQKFGRFDADSTKVTIANNSVGSIILPTKAQSTPIFNTQQRCLLERAIKACFGQDEQTLFKFLISGPEGTGKMTVIKETAAALGLVVHQPCSLTVQLFEEEITRLASFHPTLIVVKSEDFVRARMVLEKQDSSGLVMLLALHYSASQKAPTDNQFDLVIQFSNPNIADRKVLLQDRLPDLQDMDDLASETVGFSLADLIILLERIKYRQKVAKNKVDQKTMLKEQIALVRTSKSKQHSTEIPKVTWDQVAGLEEAKHLIKETIEYPLQHRDKLNRKLGKRLGILLYGPPGTGKTLLAKAIATHFGLAFIPVKGPELMSQWVGETEANIRALFQRAKESQPTIIFFDELDSIGVERGRDGDSGGVTDRIVAQLMVEMDKLGEEDADVFLVGATNRLDLLDPALLRPGRFEKAIHLGLPQSTDEQVAILKASTSKFRLAENVDLSTVIAKLEGSFRLSPADIASLANEAMRLALASKIMAFEDANGPVDYLSATEDDLRIAVSQDDFLMAIEKLHCNKA